MPLAVQKHGSETASAIPHVPSLRPASMTSGTAAMRQHQSQIRQLQLPQDQVTGAMGRLQLPCFLSLLCVTFVNFLTPKVPGSYNSLPELSHTIVSHYICQRIIICIEKNREKQNISQIITVCCALSSRMRSWVSRSLDRGWHLRSWV